MREDPSNGRFSGWLRCSIKPDVPVTLRFHSLAIQTDNGWHRRDLDAQVVGVVGPVNTGKSSLLDSCMYCLGRDVPFRKAMRRHVRAIELTARVGDEVVRLRRGRGRNHLVEVRDEAGTLVQRLPVRSNKEHQETISDWLLELLGLRSEFSSVRIGRSGAGQLTFDDLLHYLYLPQDSLDQQILFPEKQDYRRRTLFDLLFGLSNPAREKLDSDIRSVQAKIAGKKSAVRRFSDFLAGSEITNVDALASELAELKRKEVDATNRLNNLRNDARAGDSANDELRSQLNTAREQADAAEKRVDQVCDQVRQAQRGLAAIDRELAERDQGTVPMDYCPACRADLAERERAPGRCTLCTETVGDSEFIDLASLRESRRLAANEAAAADTRADQARHDAEIARVEVDQLRDLLNQRSAATLAPFMEAVSQAAAEVESIRARLSTLARLQEPHDRIREMQSEILSLEDERNELESRRSDLGSLVVNKDDLFELLDGEFRKAIDEQKVPWYAGRARLDPNTYLPMVDGQSFRDLGGGVKCAVAVAYSVALMSYAINFGPCDMPMLLVIDSPRKNVGNNNNDRAFAHRIYRNFLNQVGARQGIVRPYQVILADNDLPEDISQQIKMISFAYPADPFIPDIEDPHGEGDDEIDQRYYDGEPDQPNLRRESP